MPMERRLCQRLGVLVLVGPYDLLRLPGPEEAPDKGLGKVLGGQDVRVRDGDSDAQFVGDQEQRHVLN